MIKIVKYENNNDEFTKFLSSICDVRIIWEEINLLKKLENFQLIAAHLI